MKDSWKKTGSQADACIHAVALRCRAVSAPGPGPPSVSRGVPSCTSGGKEVV